MGAPRHLGIHSGGMVLTERPIGEVCPIERARMERRTVLQWDKDACESMGLVKFDLLGLGMLGALDHMMRLVAEHLGEEWDLATMPKEEPAVYDMLCRADSIGVFQVESRAQIGTLPRLRPREFYDLAIEIALIRPGPIQGGAVHPYVRRATGQEEVTYDHPELIPVLERTKGVPLFQEQLMAMAVTLGDCSRDDADLLRRAMGSKRGVERIESVKQKLYAGMARRGITGDLADSIYVKILSFANFGFAESHALSFALLVYASSWFKLHYPAAFLAGLLRNQPMGFYSPQSLVGDARRHGVDVRRPDVTRSAAQADLESVVHRSRSPAHRPRRVLPAALRPRRVGAGHPGPGPRPPTGRRARRPARARLGARHRPRGGAPDRLRPRGGAVHGHHRPVPPRRPDHRPARGAGHRGRVRHVGTRPPGGPLGGGLRRGRRAPARHHTGPGGAHPPRHERAGDHPGRPLGHRRLPRATPDRSPARRPAPRRSPLGRRARRRRARPARPRRRTDHPPPASRHRDGRHLPQPRGRDGHAQRRVLDRGDEGPPARRPQPRGRGHPWAARAQRGRHQPHRRPGGGHRRRRAGSGRLLQARASSRDFR